jgi:hypothetical protein
MADWGLRAPGRRLESRPRRGIFRIGMTLLDHLRSPRLDRDAAFDAAVREGRLPSTPDRCPTCGQTIVPPASHISAVPPAPSAAPAPAAPASPVSSVDQELAALGNGRSRR